MRYIDIGNSFIKIATHEEGDWVVSIRASHKQQHDVLALMKILIDSGEKFMGCSVVGELTKSFNSAFGNHIRFVQKSDIPAKELDYKTPETLGLDRFIACYGAHHLGRTAVIVVDAGTATTIDLMDRNGIFHGGVIAPGIALFENGLRDYAPSLPKVERSLPAEYPPKSTEEAVRWGITGSYLSAIRSHVESLRKINPNAHIWITGGDADVLMQLKDLKLSYHPNLVFEGLRQMSLNNYLR